MSHLVFDISAHGYGHLSQATPVINALRQLRPDLSITLRYGGDPAVVHRFLGPSTTIAPAPRAAVLAMKCPDVVDVKASLQGYLALHDYWETVIETEAKALEALKPDLLISDVDYTGLAAAKHLGLPAMAMSSLNWADIARPYLRDEPDFPAIHDQMMAAYDHADPFLRFEPALPMTGFRKAELIGPVARIGKKRDDEIRSRLELPNTTRIGLLSFGGIASGSRHFHLTRIRDFHWIIGGDTVFDRDDTTPAETLGLPFIDILASVDLVVTKPGYGMFAEAACNGNSILYTRRPDWAEYPVFVDWLNRHARAAAIDRGNLADDRLKQRIDDLLDQAEPKPPCPNGGPEAAARILGVLQG